jgi:hypothetical protein
MIDPGADTKRLYILEADSALEPQRYRPLDLCTPDYFGRASQETATQREPERNHGAGEKPFCMLYPGAVRADVQYAHDVPVVGYGFKWMQKLDAGVTAAFRSGHHSRASYSL